MANLVYLETFSSPQEWQSSKTLIIPLESLTTLFVYNICKPKGVSLKFVYTPSEVRDGITISIEAVVDLLGSEDVPWVVASCMYPVVYHKDTIITGLCAVARHICSYRTSASHPDEHEDGLLGFRQGCLQAPNEVSVWTKFCEIEIIKTVKDILNVESMKELPQNLIRFEYHLSKPVKMHNIYKLAGDLKKLKMIDSNQYEGENKVHSVKEIEVVDNTLHSKPDRGKSRVKKTVKEERLRNIEDLNYLSHQFAEGMFMTLADILLYPSYYLLVKAIGQNILQDNLPLTYEWYNKVSKVLKLQMDIFQIYVKKNDVSHENLRIPETKNVSLYSCDTKRHNPKKRLFTKEGDVETALGYLKEGMEINVTYNNLNIGSIKWDEIPAGANPTAGHLPDQRMARKAEQLENLALAVLNVAKDGDVIVDFCTGSGHLGILLAYLLPKCTLILLENKEQSLLRARKRVHEMKMKNVLFFQCNLDYFIGKFDVGVALHACGVASDLVLDKCLKVNAKFVLCPCCYGSVHATDRLVYPRSVKFSSVPIEKYLCIGHAADQTHEDHPLTVRGDRCMAIIDSDRGQLAQESGYEVTLSRLQPLTCTPKNNLLIGLPLQ